MCNFDVRTHNCLAFYAIKICEIDNTQPVPFWIYSALKVAGIPSINLAVDLANFICIDAGVPLNVYDYRKLQTPLIVDGVKEKIEVETLTDTCVLEEEILQF